MQQIPDKGQHLVRCYAAYSNRARGLHVTRKVEGGRGGREDPRGKGRPRRTRSQVQIDHPVGDTAHVLRDAGIDTVVPLDDAGAIARGLSAFLAQSRAGTALLVPPGDVERHSRRGRTAELAGLLAEASGLPKPQAVAAS